MKRATTMPDRHSSEPYDALRDYIGFGPPDEALLMEFLPLVEDRLPEVIAHFYVRVAEFPGAMAVLDSQDRIERLKATLKTWIVELLSGPWDRKYCDRRVRIGVRHVNVGLHAQYMFGAMSVVRQDLRALAREICPERCPELCGAIDKVTEYDLALMTMTYMDTINTQGQRTLQEVMLNSIPISIFCLDAEQRLTTGSPGIGSTPGLTLYQALPSDLLDALDVSACIEAAHEAGSPSTFPSVLTSSGRRLRLTIVPTHHSLAMTILHIEDLSSIHAAENRAAQAESLAQIGTLAANVAHEIRNPLAAISATLQVISMTLPPEDSRKMAMMKLQKHVARLDRLVTDLLGYARPSASNIQDVNLESCAQDALASSGVHAKLEGAETWVRADPDSVTRILVNLLMNASDAGQHVVLRLGEHWVEVQDDGPGLPDELKNQVFDPFVTTKAKGTGLGLAICQKLAEAMDASVLLIPGPPTRFRVNFQTSISPADTSTRTE